MIEIKSFYKKIWKSYDFINIVMTFGLDYLWRRKASFYAKPDSSPWLDMCCGTGEMIRHLRKIEGIRVIGCDFSSEMLEVSRAKHPIIDYCSGNASSLPFKASSLSGISVSFATRNMQNTPGGLSKVFKEFYRVLKPGGKLIHLETSQPDSAIIKFGYHLFTRLWVAPIGSLLSHDSESYRYLASSMRQFHTVDELTELLKEAGFKTVIVKRLMFGATAIHVAVK